DGVSVWVYQAELAMRGFTREQYVGRHISECHVNPSAAQEILRRLTNHETLHDYEAALRHRYGTVRHVLIDANVLWEQGKFVRARSFTRDITERKWAEATLVAHQHDLERANRELGRSNEKLSQLYETAQRFVDNV